MPCWPGRPRYRRRVTSTERGDHDAPLAVIAGTGFTSLTPLTAPHPHTIDTSYGPATVTRGTWHGIPVVFLGRHGPGHTVPPHRINYRANIDALRRLGVRDVVAIAAVGSVDPTLVPGDIVCLHDFLDFTKCRIGTFFDGTTDEGVVHTDMTTPYHPGLRAELLAAADRAGESVRDGGVYAAFEGPRFESPAEIAMAARLGGHVAGMTGVPEVTLANEAGLRYAALALVCNPGAGLSLEPVTVAQVERTLADCAGTVLAILDAFVAARAGAVR